MQVCPIEHKDVAKHLLTPTCGLPAYQRRCALSDLPLAHRVITTTPFFIFSSQHLNQQWCNHPSTTTISSPKFTSDFLLHGLEMFFTNQVYCSIQSSIDATLMLNAMNHWFGTWFSFPVQQSISPITSRSPYRDRRACQAASTSAYRFFSDGFPELAP